jgi:hypothetical protein
VGQTVEESGPETLRERVLDDDDIAAITRIRHEFQAAGDRTASPVTAAARRASGVAGHRFPSSAVTGLP